MIALSHPTGNSFVRAAAAGLTEVDLLSAFYTTVAEFEGSSMAALSSLPGLGSLRRRRYPSELRSITETHPLREIGRLAAVHTGVRSLIATEDAALSVDAVYASLDRWVASKVRARANQGLRGVYAYEDGASATFRAAKRSGLACFYDLPIGYWRAAQASYREQRERWPQYAATLSGINDSAEKLARKDTELELADRVIVASSFTAATLRNYPGQLPEVSLVPYAFPPAGPERAYEFDPSARRLKLLFVGGLSQRKGIGELFAAADRLGDAVELTVVGRVGGGVECPALTIELRKHHYIDSAPHEEILRLMRSHDALVFPSTFEGFGLVITEAMSQGTPVITTACTAGPDLIRDGEDGILIPANDVDALVQAVDGLLSSPERLATLGEAARHTSSKRDWWSYGADVAEVVGDHLRAHRRWA